MSKEHVAGCAWVRAFDRRVTTKFTTVEFVSRRDVRAMSFRTEVGRGVSLLTAIRPAKGPTHSQKIAERLSEGQSQQDAQTWTAEEELIIRTIQQTESVPRAEAIRRMQRRNRASRLAVDRLWYAARLFDLWLLDFSIPLRTGDGCFILAVAVGGRRRGGDVSFPSSKWSEHAAERLRGMAGFPEVRIERAREQAACHVVRWGVDEPSITESPSKVDAQITECRVDGEFYGYSDSAIRAFLLERFGRDAVLTTERLCRNPRCTRGSDGGPGSLAHLRADALYCDDTCKKAGQRSLRRENEPSNRQYLCGSKRDKTGSLAHPITTKNVRLKSPAIAISGFGDGDSKLAPNVSEKSRNESGLHR
jgi:uncharacterized protein DUF6302